jgi:MbtH protein
MNHRVVVNRDGQYSIWPSETDLPAGWAAEGPAGSRQECLERIDTIWTDMRPYRSRLRESLAAALEKASDGQVTAAEVLRADTSFVAMGVTSLTMVRLIDVIETELDVIVDMDHDPRVLEDLGSLVDHIAGQRLSSGTSDGGPASGF